MTPKPIDLILDWDGTITTKDTMFAYGKIADQRDSRLGRTPSGSQTFPKFGKAWMDDYTAHEQAYSPNSKDRKLPAQESAWLESLAIVESRSAKRVEDSGFFTGVKSEDVSNAAASLLQSGQVSLRSGWDKLLFKATNGPGENVEVDQKMTISILSVNWSENFIRASLGAAARQHGLDNTLGRFIETMPIASNEVSGLEHPDGSSGQLTDPNHPIIRTSADKLRNFVTKSGSYNVYVGDSTTDFDCLTTADLGICIRDEPMGSSAKSLAEMLSRVGYEVPHVSDFSSWSDRSLSFANLLWARDFDEILELLERLQSHTSRGSGK